MLDWWEKNFATCELGDKPNGIATFINLTVLTVLTVSLTVLTAIAFY